MDTSKNYLAESKAYIAEREIIGIVFDNWFTLIEPNEQGRVEKTAAITGIPSYKVHEAWPELQREPFGTTESFVEKLLTNLSISRDSPDHRDIKTRLCDYYDRDAMNCRVYPDVVDTLIYLKEKYPLGLLSNTHSPYKKPFFQYSLDEFFIPKAICFSDEIGARKPESVAYKTAVRKLGLPVFYRSILFVGDDPSNDAIVPRESEDLLAILLDRGNKHEKIPYRILSLTDLKDLL